MSKPLTSRVDTAIWLSIFIGMFTVGLGLALQRGDASTLGWFLVVIGGAAIAVGVGLVWVRSRMGEPTDGRT